MIREMLSAYRKRSSTCCISNFKTKRVKKFRTLETDGELLYNNTRKYDKLQIAKLHDHYNALTICRSF